MKAYLFGIFTTLVVLAGIVYFYLSMGFLNTRTDISQSMLESKYAMKFLDASVDRHTPTDTALFNLPTPTSPVARTSTRPTARCATFPLSILRRILAIRSTLPHQIFSGRLPICRKIRTSTPSSTVSVGVRCQPGKAPCPIIRSGPWSLFYVKWKNCLLWWMSNGVLHRHFTAAILGKVEGIRTRRKDDHAQFGKKEHR